MLTACISFGVAMTTNTHFRGEELKKVWLNRYPADVPTEINPDRYQSLVDMFEQSVARYADQPAFVNMGEVMTFRKLEERSRAFAAYLQQGLGLKKGDRVALMMPNLLQYPVALFGILRAGMIVVNVNPLYTPRELEHQLNDSGASAIVIVSNFAHTLEKVVDKTAVQHVILTRMGDQLSTAKGTVVNFVVKYIKRFGRRNTICQMPYHFVAHCITATGCSTSNPNWPGRFSFSAIHRRHHWCGERRDADSPQYAGEPWNRLTRPMVRCCIRAKSWW